MAFHFIIFVTAGDFAFCALLPTMTAVSCFIFAMHSLESLLTLIEKFKKANTDRFIDEFQEIYFNERLFEQIPESIKEPMDNIVLAVGLTRTDEEERASFGAYLSPEGLEHTINENLPLIQKQLDR